jgi:hypothetical protein
MQQNNENTTDMEPSDLDLQAIKRNIINKLPNDLVNKIYKEYLEPEVYYVLYKNIIETPSAMRLNGTELTRFIPIILSKQNACSYIMTKCRIFHGSYKEHKIKQNKRFVLMKKGESFAAYILLSLYH